MFSRNDSKAKQEVFFNKKAIYLKCWNCLPNASAGRGFTNLGTVFSNSLSDGLNIMCYFIGMKYFAFRLFLSFLANPVRKLEQSVSLKLRLLFTSENDSD